MNINVRERPARSLSGAEAIARWDTGDFVDRGPKP